VTTAARPGTCSLDAGGEPPETISIVAATARPTAATVAIGARQRMTLCQRKPVMSIFSR
jgi:hypothetical protein